MQEMSWDHTGRARRAHEASQHRRPAPLRCSRVPLSPLDTRWVALTPVCHVFLFPAVVGRRPCAQLVPRSGPSGIPPFSRRGHYAPELGTVDIVCGEDAGVAFVESETDIDFARLVVGLDEDALLLLVPDICRE
ncbi:uncharacterized protein [Miscanthus floridulus]|uniref:uncharacterized protein n=1 Tax=Miscanthus floridulus TaxID=154761 RepID=UPI00345ADBBE